MPLPHASLPVLLNALLRKTAPLRRWLAWTIPLLLWTLTGCASAPVVYGDHARFSPAFRGYVMAPYDGSDDPGTGDAVLVLRDPVTGTKLRCGEQVQTWRELYEDVAADAVHDDNAAITAAVATGAFFAPVVALQPLGGLVLMEAMYTTEMLYGNLRSASATELLATAVALHGRKRYPQASMLIERALAKDSSVGTAQSAYLYLGLSYVEQGHKSRARVALDAFVERATVRDAEGYRRAEAALKTLGVARKPCASLEPVELHW